MKPRALRPGERLFQYVYPVGQREKPIGPLKEIPGREWVYSLPAPSQVLWRYIEDFKFRSLLKDRAFYFSRPDTFAFGDPLSRDEIEGLPSPANKIRSSVSDQALEEAYGIKRDYEARHDEIDLFRKTLFVICWSMAETENIDLWNKLSEKGRNDSVAIVTTARALSKQLPHLARSKIKYHKDEDPRTEFSHGSLVFYKPLRYQDEREFRLVRFSEPGESIDLEKDTFRLVPAPLERIIHKVVVHPCATKSWRSEVQKLVAQHLPYTSCEFSAVGGKVGQQSSQRI